MNTKSIERQAGFYKILSVERYSPNGQDTGMYWVTDSSRVLLTEEECRQYLLFQH
jgi:hypothetical protein